MARKRYIGQVLLHAPIGGRTHGRVLEYGLENAKDEAWRFAVMDGYRQGGLRWRRPSADPGAWHLAYAGSIVGTVREFRPLG